jgi:phospholipase C
VYGPNGFYRLFKGNDEDAGLNILLGYETETDDIPTGNVVLQLKNNGNSSLSIDIRDNAYKAPSITKQLNANAQQNVVMDLSKNFGWYDLSITVNGNSMFEKRYAGHLETGKESRSDPVMSGT